jgi:hypothetical protein
MIARRSNRTPTLAVAARAAAAERATERRKTSPVRRWSRRAMVFVALLFGAMAVVGGAGAKPAMAWPWDDAANLPGIIVNFCGPADVPTLTTFGGSDNDMGLNLAQDAEEAKRYAELRKTVMPAEIPMDGSGYDRLKEAFPSGGDYDPVIKPTYDRYGFDTLRWTNFQQGCASIGFWSAWPVNFVFEWFVKVPSMWTMAFIHLAINHPLYDIFGALIQPFVSIFAAIFRPWVVVFAIMIGLPLVWAKTRGSMSKMVAAAVWIAFIMGSYLWITQNTSKVVTTANNFVTSFTSEAACQLMEAGVEGSSGTCSGAGGTAGINNALWRGIPYNTWMVGEVGDAQAARDRAAEADGRIGWSQAILNSLYIGTTASGEEDEAGKEIRRHADAWNKGSYGKNGDDTKTDMWTEHDQWKKVPFLTLVKFMCNDDEPDNGKDGNGDDENNRWSRSSCDAGEAGTASWIGYFRGDQYNQRLNAVFTGSVAGFMVLIALGFASLFVAYQKMLFFWILLWAPLWLAIGAIPQKREYAVKYAERAVAVIIYQCVGVLVVLFVAHSLAVLLFPPPGSNIPEIPTGHKPTAAILYFVTMITLYYPARKIGRAVVKNDTDIVRKTLDAPADAAKWTIKTTVKAAVVAGVAAATGGTSLGAAALSSGKAGAAATLLSSSGGKTGKLVASGLRLAEWRKKLGDLKGTADGQKRAEKAGAEALINQDPAKYGLQPGQRPTAAAMAKAVQDFRKAAKTHERGTLVEDQYNKAMQQQFAAHRRQRGEFHPLDPANPLNKDVDPGVLRARMLLAMNDKALDVVNSPKWGTGADLKARVDLSSDQIKLNANVTNDREAAQNLGGPNGILAQYNNNPGLMDPRHQATPALMKLMFAEPNPDSEQFKAAFREAASAVASYGVPNKVDAVWSVGQTAQDFSGMSVLGVMRQLDPNDSVQQRLNDAIAFSAASASIPADHPAFQVVNQYREALANPGVSAGEVNTLGLNVASAFQSDNPHLIQPSTLSRDLAESMEEAGRRFAQQAGTREGWGPPAGWSPSPSPEDQSRYQQSAVPSPPPVPDRPWSPVADPTAPPPPPPVPANPLAAWYADLPRDYPRPPASGFWSDFNPHSYRVDIAEAVRPLFERGISPTDQLRDELRRLQGDPYAVADTVRNLVDDHLRRLQASPPPPPPAPPPPPNPTRWRTDRDRTPEREDPGSDPHPNPGSYEGNSGRDTGPFGDSTWDSPS